MKRGWQRQTWWAQEGGVTPGFIRKRCVACLNNSVSWKEQEPNPHGLAGTMLCPLDEKGCLAEDLIHRSR